MASIIIPLAPVIAGVVAGFITHMWKMSMTTPGAAMNPFVPLPVVVAGVVGAIVGHWLSPSPKPPLAVPGTHGEPLHTPSAVVGVIVSALLQFTTQVLWPILQQYFFPGPAVVVPPH